MFDDLYNESILNHASSIPLSERLPQPDVSVFKESRLCGSKITTDLVIENGKITQYGADVESCSLGQASASILAEHVIGLTLEDVRKLFDQMRAMLKEDAPPPNGIWKEMELLLPARDYPSRHASVLLPLEALLEAFEEAAKADEQTGES